MNSLFLTFYFFSFILCFCQEKAQLDWVNTGSNMTIAILDVPKDIIFIGDTIAVFYDDDNKKKCGGFVIWNNDRVALSVWGDDSTTEEKDGFNVGEKLHFIVSSDDNICNYADATNLIWSDDSMWNADSVFATNGMSGLSLLEITNLYVLVDQSNYFNPLITIG